MSLKEWYHNVTMNKEYLEDIPSSTYYRAKTNQLDYS